MFDLRHLEHSTIIYEDPTHTPLLRLAWNKQVLELGIICYLFHFNF